MFEFHGWFNLTTSPRDVNLERDDAFARRLRERVAALNWPRALAFAEVHVLNGQSRLILGGCRNHRGQTAAELGDLLAFVAAEAPGSHGLLYWRDDEGDPPAGPNNYQVEVMARGSLTLRFDPFLSPTVPVTEDAWEPGVE